MATLMGNFTCRQALSLVNLYCVTDLESSVEAVLLLRNMDYFI